MGYKSIEDKVRQGRAKLESGLTERSIVVPINAAIPVAQQVLTDQQVRDLLRATDLVAVTECDCRTVEGRCDAPKDVCIVLGETARGFAGNSRYRTLTVEEAMRVLDRTAELGLVHLSIWSRGHTPEAICSCCPCCCSELRAMSEFGYPDHVIRSDFVAGLDHEACAGCGTCVDRCAFGAIAMVDGAAELARDRCFGCGACVTTCPSGALTLSRRP